MLFYLIAFMLIIGLPIGVLTLIYSWLARKGCRKLGLLLIFSSVAYIGFEIYRAFYPGDNFYREDFTHETGMPLPPSAEILSKDANYPDFHGHYTSAALVKLSGADYWKLRSNMRTEKRFRPIDSLYYGRCDRVVPVVTDAQVEQIFGCKKMEIAFLKDHRHVLLERCLGEIYPQVKRPTYTPPYDAEWVRRNRTRYQE